MYVFLSVMLNLCHLKSESLDVQGHARENVLVLELLGELFFGLSVLSLSAHERSFRGYLPQGSIDITVYIFCRRHGLEPGLFSCKSNRTDAILVGASGHALDDAAVANGGIPFKGGEAEGALGHVRISSGSARAGPALREVVSPRAAPCQDIRNSLFERGRHSLPKTRRQREVVRLFGAVFCGFLSRPSSKARDYLITLARELDSNVVYDHTGAAWIE